MATKDVLRSVRLEAEVDHRLTQMAAQQGVSVSACIRAALADATVRDERRKRLEQALLLAAALPVGKGDPDEERRRMWGLGRDVSR